MDIRKLIFKNLAKYFENKGNNRDALLGMVPHASVCAEIGVWKGDFSKQILKKIKPVKLYLIDPWKYIPEHESSWHGGTIAQSQNDMDDIYKSVKKTFRKNKNIVILRNFSKNAVKKLKDDSLDFVYLDGDHHFAAITNDLIMYFRKVKPGGIIAGDDYYSFWNLLNGLPVKRAVDNFVKNYHVKALSFGRQFVLRKL